MRSTLQLLGTFVLLLLAGGCGGSDDGAEPADAAATTPATPPPQSAELDRLRALPYAGYSGQSAAEAPDGVVRYDPQRCWPGYTLYVVHPRCLAELIDEQGRVVRRWSAQPGQFWAHGELLPNGDFLVPGSDVAARPPPAVEPEKLYLLRFNWDGKLLWKRYLTAHHDVELTPRGQLLTLTFQCRTIPAVHPKIPVKDDYLTLVADDGRVLERLSIYEALSARPEIFPLARVGENDWGGGRWIDLLHTNSVEWVHHPDLADRHPIYAPTNVLVCFRHQNRVAIIDWERRAVVWAWGAGELSGPHDAHVLADGNVLIFDNGMERFWSRVVEVDPLSGMIVWKYRAPDPKDFFTMSKGAAQRLPNGNTLITSSDQGWAFEVTPAGEIVWDFRCPYRDAAGRQATLVRAVRYGRDFIEQLLSRRAATAPAAP